MPPKNWMMNAPGAAARAAPSPNTAQARRIPAPGPGFVSMRNRIDLCAPSLASMVPTGVNTPWLMALLRNSTLAGSTRMLIRGRMCAETSQSTPAIMRFVRPLTRGAMPKNAPIARRKPRIPAEKLLTSISKPALILPSQMRSTCFIR